MPSPSQLLSDVLDSGRTIQGWCHGRTYSEYEQDRQFRRSVEREFEIIAEALMRMERQTPELAGRIHEMPRIVGFSNRIIHGYDAIDHATVWGVINGHLVASTDPAETARPRAEITRGFYGNAA